MSYSRQTWPCSLGRMPWPLVTLRGEAEAADLAEESVAEVVAEVESGAGARDVDEVVAGGVDTDGVETVGVEVGVVFVLTRTGGERRVGDVWAGAVAVINESAAANARLRSTAE